MQVIAFYLPQFHPIPENNKWWGEGFTDWTNVALSRSRFKGHRQPQIPADLGFYDLRLRETREAQARLAIRYGLSGFCYYHYWFNGKMLLDRPLREVLREGSPNFPFCMCWANENWTRVWDGMERKVLIRQEYSGDDSNKHFRKILQYFYDSRYIKIDDKPLFLVYRYENIPEPLSYFNEWRVMAEKAGFDGIFLCAVKNSYISTDDEGIINLGFDAVIDFQPNRSDFPVSGTIGRRGVVLARNLLPSKIYQWIKVTGSAVNRIDYKTMVEGLMKKSWPNNYLKFPCIFPSWDNTPRRKTPTVIQNDTPELYGSWLRDALSKVNQYEKEKRLVFINSWNEWAEGCHLEPDREYGHLFLEQTLEAIKIGVRSVVSGKK